MADLETIQYQVEEDNAGQRLDIFLATQNPSHSRSSLHKLITEGMVKINSLLPKASYVVKKGEKVIVRYPIKKLFPSAENNAFSIIFEDEVLLVVDKPAGMSVHPTTMEEKGTLVQAVLHHSARIADAVYDPESAISRMRPGIVHRLDKDTTGVLVIAKTTEALKALSDQFRLHTVVKEYQAIVYGALTDPTTVHTNIGRKPMKRSLMGVKEAGEGREAITHFYPEKTLFWKPTEQEATWRGQQDAALPGTAQGMDRDSPSQARHLHTMTTAPLTPTSASRSATCADHLFVRPPPIGARL